MTIDYGNDVTCHAVPVILFLFPLKNDFTPQMEKEETNFNKWGETTNSELVLEDAKVERKYEKEHGKRRFEACDFPRNFAGNFK